MEATATIFEHLATTVPLEIMVLSMLLTALATAEMAASLLRISPGGRRTITLIMLMEELPAPLGGQSRRRRFLHVDVSGRQFLGHFSVTLS